MILRLLLPLFVATLVRGLSCAPPSSPKAAWELAGRVFTGRVETVRPAPLVVHVTARVKEAFKGVEVGAEVTFQAATMLGDFQFQPGDEYLFYVLQQGQEWTVSPCLRTRLIRLAPDDLQFLRGLPESAEGTRLSGVLVMEGLRRPGPMEGVVVKAHSGAQTLTARTGADGVYVFSGLAPGAWRVAPELPPGVAVERHRITRTARTEEPGMEGPVEIGEGEQASWDLFAAYAMRIRVSVIAPDGTPFPEVRPVAVGPAGRSERGWPSGDDYDLTGLPPGTYRVQAIPLGWRADGSPFPPVEAPAAVTVSVEAPRAEVVIRMPAAPRWVRLSGVVVDAAGAPLRGAWVDFKGGDYWASSEVTGADGRFELKVLAGRRGELRARGGGPPVPLIVEKPMEGVRLRGVP